MLVLASNSPRRRQLLALGGWQFSSRSAAIDESVLPGEAPLDYVHRMAENKARTVSHHVRSNGTEISSDVLVVAADTAVVDGIEIMGKPSDQMEAQRMLGQLRGRTHQVYTALAVLRPKDGKLVRTACVTDVLMRAYCDEEISAYIASGDPFDKAGGYAIQHAGLNPVESFEGCYANVMGLPLCHLTILLADFGIFPATDITSVCQSSLDTGCLVFRQITGEMDHR